MEIEFAQKVSFPTKVIDEEGQQLAFSYPKPYFKTVGDTVIDIYGNYVEELTKKGYRLYGISHHRFKDCCK